MVVKSCPPGKVLSDYCLGKLTVSEKESLETHLESCPTCRQTVEQFKPDAGQTQAKRRVAQALLAAGWMDGEVPKTTDDYLNCLAASHLSSLEAARAAIQAVPAPQRPADSKACAALLVEKKILTAYQARAILQGKPHGLIVAGREILDLLGKGGMGNVFKARNLRLDRIEALKVIAPQMLESADIRQRFDREVRAAARINHPNVVTTYDGGETDGVHFLAMEFVDGGDLSRVVKERGPLSVEHAVACVLQAAAGLGAAHAQGIIHRDIKPHNLLIDRKGRVKILDLGLARLNDPQGGPQAQQGLTQSGQIMGTIDYMSPEQILDVRTVGPPADVYSLGCTLHFLLTGKPPFQADSLGAKMMAHHQQPVPSLRAARADIPPVLDAVFQRMLAKKPEERFKTMSEVVTALRGVGTAAALPSSISSPAIDVRSHKPPTPRDTAVGNDALTIVRPSAQKSSSRQFLVVSCVALLLAVTAAGVYFSLPTTKEQKSLKTPPLGPVAGKETYALEFDGKSYVEIPNFKYDGSHPLTFEARMEDWRDQTGSAAVVSALFDSTCFAGDAPYRTAVKLSAWNVDLAKQCPAINVHSNPITEKNQIFRAWPRDRTEEFIDLAVVIDQGRIEIYRNGRMHTESKYEYPAVKSARGETATRIGALTDADPLKLYGYRGRIERVRISRVARYKESYDPPKSYEADDLTMLLYRMDEGKGDVLHDSSGNGCDGKITGAQWVTLPNSETPQVTASNPPSVAPVAANKSDALEFDGKTYIDIPKFKYDGSGPLTFEAILEEGRPQELATGSFAVYLFDHCESQGEKPFWTEVRLVSWEVDLQRFNPKVNADYGSAKLKRVFQNRPPLRRQAMTQLAVVFDQGSVEIFRDGKKETDSNFTYGSPSAETPPVPARIGAKLISNSCCYRGRMECVRISKTARYKSDYTPPLRFERDEDTYLLYRFDEGQGNILHDASGNGLDGKIVGGKWVKRPGSNLPIPENSPATDR